MRYYLRANQSILHLYSELYANVVFMCTCSAHSGLKCEKSTIFGSFFTNTLSSGLMRFLITEQKTAPSQMYYV